METTLLLVDPDQLPAGLEEQLAAKGAFVETTTSDELEPTVIAVAPDLVIGMRSASLSRVLGVLARQDPVVKIVVLANWKEHKELRARREPIIGAILSRDTPVALLAGRIIEFGGRAARGEPLQHTPSLVPSRSARIEASPAAHLGVNEPKSRVGQREKQSNAPGQPTVVAAAKVSVRPAKVFSAERAPAELRGADQPGVRRPQTTLTPPAPNLRPFGPSSGQAAGEQAGRAGTAKSGATAYRAPAQTLLGIPAGSLALARAPARESEPDSVAPSADPPAGQKPRAALPGPPPQTAQTPEPDLDDAGWELDDAPAPEVEESEVRGVEVPSTEPVDADKPHARATRGSGPTEELAADVETISVPANEAEQEPEPAGADDDESERVSLTFSQRPLPPLRLALVDTDMTRAGALAEALRARGITTQLVAPSADATRWHLLRRFAPQGLVMDEDGLSHHAQWLEAIRLDPFLYHLPLLAVPLARMFRESTGRSDISLLVPHLLPLGAEEAALRDRLGGGRKIEFRLDQIGPARLVEVASGRSRLTTLECEDGEGRLVWGFSPGQAGGAELTVGVSAPEELTAEQALDWLLAHPECRIVAREGEMQRGPLVPVEALLEAATSEEAVPPPPPPRSAARTAPRGMIGARDLPTAAAGEVAAARGGLVAEGRARFDQLRGVARERFDQLPPRGRYGVIAVGALLVLALGYGILRGDAGVDAAAEVGVNETGPQEANVGAESAPAGKGPGGKIPGPPGSSSGDAEGLFKVASNTTLAPCEESLVAGEEASAAAGHLQKARQRLVAGDTEGARVLMCKAARLDPKSPASEGLALIYLSARSLDEAQHWAEEASRENPDRRSAQELLGDVANQRGELEESRRIWLGTMRLTGDETEKLEAVSRSQVREAMRAVKSSDLPRAERLLRRAITMDPKHAAAAAALAQVFLDLKEREVARRWAEHALGLDRAVAGTFSDELRDLVGG